MSKISILIIALHLVTSSDFVLASDPSAYEAAILRIDNEIRVTRRTGCTDLMINSYNKKLDEAEVIIKDYLGLDALSELRPIRNEVEIAPFRDKIVLMKDRGELSFWGAFGDDNYKLASSPKLSVGYIGPDRVAWLAYVYYFYKLKNNDSKTSTGVSIYTSRLIKGATEIRIPTHDELIEIKEDVSARGVVISYKTTAETLAIIDRQYQKAAWEGRKPWLVALEQAKRAVHGVQTSAGASVASSEDLK